MGQEATEAVIAANAARALSPATIDVLEDDLAVSGGMAYRFLAARARGILDGARCANPVREGDLWAFDIDGFVLKTSVPHSGKTLREAREILQAALRRSLEVAPLPRDGSARDSRVASAGVGIAVALGKHAARRMGAKGDGSAQRASHENADSDNMTLDRILSDAHYTRVPAWLLDGGLDLTVSERILLSDILDAMAGGTVLSYDADRARIARRCGLNASTASCALRGLLARGVIARPEGVRGRYAVRWGELAALARRSPAAAKTVGRATVEADIRRRLSATAGSLAVPCWAVECCGATEAALLLSKAWATAHCAGDGVVWASGQTLSHWLPGAERSLRRARASLASRGLATYTPQHSRARSYRSGAHPNRTAELATDARTIARALVARGHDFGDLNAVMAQIFSADASLHREAAAWDMRRACDRAERSLRAKLAWATLKGLGGDARKAETAMAGVDGGAVQSQAARPDCGPRADRNKGSRQE